MDSLAPPHSPPCSRPRLKKWGLALASGCILVCAAYASRAPLLTAAANLWSINDTLTPADALVILGGNIESRPFGAAELYHQGLAAKILITDVRWEPGKLLGLAQSPAELTRQILLKKGVPEAAIGVVGNQVTSTWDEAVAVRDWACSNQTVTSVIIVTDLFHTRRCRWLFRKQLHPLGAGAQAAAVRNSDYAATNWWRHEHGLIAFQSEVVKHLYYRAKY